MDRVERSFFVWVVLWMVLLFGCSAGRRSAQYREIKGEVRSVHRDSLWLRNLYQASRNQAIDIEHVVFDSCRSDGIRSVTRVAMKEHREVEAESDVHSGSADHSRSVTSETFRKRSVAKFSFPKWIGVTGLIISVGCLVWIGTKTRKRG